jgi:stage II sporulation protein GA (sporulation sigma-E factor processing peptidase)
MEVLYVDVYFLINFTVDAIAVTLAAKLLHIKSGVVRIVGISAIGSSVAVADAILPLPNFARAMLGVFFIVSLAIIIARDISYLRRFKAIIVFLCFEMLLGGIVNYGYNILDRYVGEVGEYFSAGTANRKALLFSILILLAIGVLKLFIMLFSEQTRVKSTRISIKMGASEIECDALVDSGNLVKDPLNMNPVLFVKRHVAEKLFPREIVELTELDNLDVALQKRIRLIPVTRGGETHVMTGFLPDSVKCTERGEESLSITLAIDREDGTYGGYDALLPASVLEV